MTTSPLVSVGELSSLLGTVVVLDVRYRMGGPPGRAAYLAGHVPGAAYVDLDVELASAPGAGGRHPLPDTGRFERAMRKAGVGVHSPVVVYDDWSGRAAARCWWLLRFHGHRDVRVLDGGWSAWVAEGGTSETGEVAPGPGNFVAAPGSMPVVTSEDVLEVARIGALVDARAAERYRGEVEPIDPVAGHIPGAVNRPTEGNLDAQGRFRPADELRRVYAAEADAARTGPVAAYCGSGVTAAHDVLAMEVAGIPAALYPGSWSEWVSDPARPCERSGS